MLCFLTLGSVIFTYFGVQMANMHTKVLDAVQCVDIFERIPKEMDVIVKERGSLSFNHAKPV